MSNVKTGCAVGDMSQYRMGEQSECIGSHHKLLLQWSVRGSKVVQGELPEAAVVCDGHLSAFIGLGQREGYKFSIVSDDVVESPVVGERETK